MGDGSGGWAAGRRQGGEGAAVLKVAGGPVTPTKGSHGKSRK